MTLEPLVEGEYYHIFNRGNNRETIFRTAENYRFFLTQYAKYVYPVAQTFAYCLIPNHFHLAQRIRTSSECALLHQKSHSTKGVSPTPSPSRSLQNFFTSYAKAYNQRYGRTGSLFQKRFRRKRVTDERYFATLIVYIHRNPEKHGLTDDFRQWPWSSYKTFLSDQPTRLETQQVLDWFGGRQGFIDLHERPPDEPDIAHLIED